MYALTLFSWTAKAHENFAGIKLKDGVDYFLGTLPPKLIGAAPLPIRTPKRVSLRTYFDSRTEWPGYIHPAADQGQCAASWAFGAAG